MALKKLIGSLKTSSSTPEPTEGSESVTSTPSLGGFFSKKRLNSFSRRSSVTTESPRLKPLSAGSEQSSSKLRSRSETATSNPLHTEDHLLAIPKKETTQPPSPLASVVNSAELKDLFYLENAIEDEESPKLDQSNPFDTNANEEESNIRNHDQNSHITMSSYATTTAATNDLSPIAYSSIPLNKSLAEPFVASSKVLNETNLTGLNDDSMIEFNGEKLDNSLPFGDGAMKMYGMENFGASCYCNSIVQSLYYTKLFRKLILLLPTGLLVTETNVPRKPKKEMPGLKTHHFITAMQNHKIDDTGDVSGSTTNENSDGNDSSDNNGSRLGRRMSFFSKKDKTKDDSSRQNSSAGIPEHEPDTLDNAVIDNDNSLDNDTSDEQRIYRAQSNYPGLKNLKLGYEVPNRNITVIGVVDDPNATAEQRKRKALINGPILNIDHPLTEGSNTMFGALKDIFECMVEHESQIGVVSPLHLLDVLKQENALFRSMMHQDAHEFFNFLLNSVFESIDGYYNLKKEMLPNMVSDPQKRLIELQKLSSEKNWSSELFEGLLTSQTKCLRCETISSRDEKFLDLSIDLENNTSITACLKQFSAHEILCEDNKFYCEHCSALQEATKRMVVKKLPKVLTLHLKRFKYSEQLNRNIKLFHRVSYPLYLRLFNTLQDTVRPDRVYELYSVVVHIGGGPYHGHYVSLVKTEYSGWLLFDDETVESIDENFVLRFFGDGPGLASAYILFYQEISEEEYMNKTLYQHLDFNLDMEEELSNEINANGTANGTANGNNSSNNGFHIPDFKRKNSYNHSHDKNNNTHLSPVDINKSFSKKQNNELSQAPVSPISPTNVQNKGFQRSKSISLKSPLSNSFKFSHSPAPASEGSILEDNTKESTPVIRHHSVAGDSSSHSTTEGSEEKPKERRKSIFGFNKKPKNKK